MQYVNIKAPDHFSGQNAFPTAQCCCAKPESALCPQDFVSNTDLNFQALHDLEVVLTDRLTNLLS